MSGEGMFNRCTPLSKWSRSEKKREFKRWSPPARWTPSEERKI
jgi:hypothetical protein